MTSADATLITAQKDGFDVGVLREAFGCFPSGVTAFCAMVDGRPIGMAASSFTSVSLDPALVSVCVGESSTTWPHLANRDTLGLSVLSSAHGPVARALSARSSDRFGDIDWIATERGAVFVHGATLWLECAPYAAVPAGDHTIVILRIVALAMRPDIEPMVFHRSGFHGVAAR
ncbi:flavin reductase family protein [Nocardia sp. NPDC058379]|uniref:flavin reductase family protein n=1 Tax=unclassified Nocardia TaxID=2637762 RepID=UPI003669E40B